jgi:hypothetical protein
MVMRSVGVTLTGAWMVASDEELCQIPTYRESGDTMKTDDEIKRDVEAELRWDPDIDATDIAVSAKGGVVTLAGFVPSYLQKFEAEKDAKRVQGVVGVANDLEVRLPSTDRRPDPDIARDAVEALKMQLPYSYQNLKESNARSRKPSSAVPRWTRKISRLRPAMAKWSSRGPCIHGLNANRPNARHGRHRASSGSRTASSFSRKVAPAHGWKQCALGTWPTAIQPL